MPRHKKSPRDGQELPFSRLHRLLLGLFLLKELLVLVVELINATGSVNEFHLTSVERVRSAGDFELHERVFVAVFPLDGVLGVDGRARQEGHVIRHIFENNQSVILGVNVFFHRLISF